ncbi:MAG: zinc ribbon domain-containing protein [Deltaproteobacteria bacterium]|nr:MAG: zinc ribbon domain-containing protein [Deltaproteobacteria bacterium]
MPLYEFKCNECGSVSEHIATYAERETVRFDCGRLYDMDDLANDPDAILERYERTDDHFAICKGQHAYAGLSQCAVGRSHVFGLIMGDGRKVAGMMNGKDAPLRKRK